MTETKISSRQTEPRFIQADYGGYAAATEKLRTAYFKFPRVVSIETLVDCNARCSFCPYPASPRKGQEMQDSLFLKIIEDLSVIPTDHAFRITLSRINEPLLDKRLRYFHEVIAERLPSAAPTFWSNGTMLRKGAFEWMACYKRGVLSVSLNAIDEEEHTQMMGFGLKRVLANLDYVHALVEADEFPLTVSLSAPFQSDEQATRIEAYCKSRWPRFLIGVRPLFIWRGGSEKGADARVSSGISERAAWQAAHLSCAQWFDLHILANGVVTKCCIDETGFEGDEKFNAARRNVLDIYRESAWLREQLPDRSTVKGCEGCEHLG